jgi:addiction module HigA family antidote
MTNAAPLFNPDYASPPGNLLLEYLHAQDISARELARRCGRSPKLIVEILAGKAPIEPGTALQFEHVLGLQADVWLQMEAAYRLHLARAAEEKDLSESQNWTNRFPVNELIARGYLQKSVDRTDNVRHLLQFFRAGSVAACKARFEELASVSFRHSPSFDSAEEPLLVWLQIGEIEAEKIDCPDYDRSRFVTALQEIRGFTNEPIEKAYSIIRSKCAGAGVVFVVIKPLKGTSLSGISRWITPRKGLIQQTMRHMTDDHFWFTFFHEAAHLLLHSRKTVFLDGKDITSGDQETEDEANAWATNMLIPTAEMRRFLTIFGGTEYEVMEFAQELGIAPGIVVGQLQTQGQIPYSRMNKFKRRYEWIA